MHHANGPATPLARRLTLTAATAVVIGNVIGTGVFLKARVMTCNVGSPGMVLTAWVAAGLLVLAGALTYAELAAMLPEAAGEYVFVREGYGRRWGFLYGWMQSLIAFPGSSAAKGVAFAIFLNIILDGALGGEPAWLGAFGYQFPFGRLQLAAVASIVVFTLINCAAVAVTGRVAVVLTAIKIALILAIGTAAFLFGYGSWAHFETGEVAGVCEGVAVAARGGWAGFGAAMLGALWAYDGWANITLIAGEVENPRRTIPIGLIGGMGAVIVLYLFANLAYFYVLTPTDVANTAAASSVATEVTRRFLGALAVSLVAASMLISTVGSLHTGILAGSRIPYALSRDGLFFRRLGYVSPRTHVPRNAVIWIGAWSVILAVSGSFDALTDYVIFAEFLFYAMVTASVFSFRKRLPHLARPYRAWGYPVVPLMFVLVSCWLLVSTILTAPRQTLSGLALIALGLPFYWYWSRASTADAGEPAQIGSTTAELDR